MELADIPRPGFWIGHDPEIELCDGRLFTQAQTDVLIVIQLWCHFRWGSVDRDTQAAHAEILGDDYIRNGGLYSQWYMREFPAASGYIYRPWRPGEPNLRPTTQRGGIHSRSAVRWLARAVWRDRDLRWRESVVDDAAARYSMMELD